MYGTAYSTFYGDGSTSLSVNNVNSYVIIIKVTRSYFSHASEKSEYAEFCSSRFACTWYKASWFVNSFTAFILISGNVSAPKTQSASFSGDSAGTTAKRTKAARRVMMLYDKPFTQNQ
jgi:hypothetical protein